MYSPGCKIALTIQDPGPNSPLPFILQSVYNLIPPDLRSNMTLMRKLLMYVDVSVSFNCCRGMPFYGYDFEMNTNHREAIVGTTYLQLLHQYKPKLQWDDFSHEHFFQFKKDKISPHSVYYPSLQFIQDRVVLAEELTLGIAIWEIGQGLPFFYDLL